MKVTLTIFTIFFYSFICNGQTNVTLSDAEIKDYTEQAIKTVKDLGTYIKVMVDKANSMGMRNANMQLAIGLFSSDTNTVAVTSLSNPSVKSYRKVRQYFGRVRDLPYQSVDITVFDTRVSKNFIQGKDGRYYGTVSFCQIFEGKLLIENRVATKTDTTCKTVEVIIEKLDCMDGLEQKACWILKLGNIDVSEQK